MELSKVLSISEVSEIDSKSGERVCRILKNIVGRDPMTVNVKYRRQLRNVVVNAAPRHQAIAACDGEHCVCRSLRFTVQFGQSVFRRVVYESIEFLFKCFFDW